jgi:hypothetical protein
LFGKLILFIYIILMGPLILKYIFQFCLLGALILSFYFFIDVIVFKNKTYTDIFSTWQFPMLLALFMDVMYKS